MYNQLEKLRIDDLKTEHVRIILLAIPTRRMSQWYACREGDVHWQPISDIPDFYEDVRAMKGLSPAGEFKSDKELAEAVRKADMLDTRIMKTKPDKRASSRRASDHQRPTSKPVAPPAGKLTQEHRPLFEEAPTETREAVDLRSQTNYKVATTPAKERRTARRYPRHFGFSVKHKDQVFESETKDISLGGVSLVEELPAWIPKTFRAKLLNNGQAVRILCTRVSANKLRIEDAESWDVIRKWLVKW